MGNHSSILAWRIPRTEVGYSPWGRKEEDMTEQLPHYTTHTSQYRPERDPAENYKEEDIINKDHKVDEELPFSSQVSLTPVGLTLRSSKS